MPGPILYGPSYSTYTRTARLVLEEKGVEYTLEQVNILTGEGRAESHSARQPFGKVPAFAHDGFELYETGAVIRYVDRAFPGPSLQPADPRQAGRMDQIIGIIDAYGYGAILGKLVWQRLIVPMQGGQADESAIEGALGTVKLVLSEINRLKGSNSFLAGSEVSLADCFVAPIFAYLTMTPDAEALLRDAPGLSEWWGSFSQRPSMQKTPPQFG